MQDRSCEEWVRSCGKQAVFVILALVTRMARILLKKQ
jgi:hypothetical protein